MPSFKRKIHLRLQYNYSGDPLSLTLDYRGFKKCDQMVDGDESMAQEFI